MNPMLLLLAAAALACVAAAVLLWHLAGVQARRRQVMRRLGQGLAPAAQAARPQAGGRRVGPGLLATLLRRVDLPPTVPSLLLVLLPAPVFAAFVASVAGPAVGLLALVLGALLAGVAFAVRRNLVQRRLTHAVPAFVDAMTRSVALGQSMGAAFQAALPGAPAPLRGPLGQVEALHAAGLDLDTAFTLAGRTYGNEALLLLGAVMRMGTRYGGRVDQVLERLAAFLRDRREAEEELSAVSAETRMSAWILGTLPVGVTLVIVFANAAYLAGMWNDPAGRWMLLGAFALELAGAFFLYRLARLR